MGLACCRAPHRPRAFALLGDHHLLAFDAVGLVLEFGHAFVEPLLQFAERVGTFTRFLLKASGLASEAGRLVGKPLLGERKVLLGRREIGAVPFERFCGLYGLRLSLRERGLERIEFAPRFLSLACDLLSQMFDLFARLGDSRLGALGFAQTFGRGVLGLRCLLGTSLVFGPRVLRVARGAFEFLPTLVQRGERLLHLLLTRRRGGGELLDLALPRRERLHRLQNLGLAPRERCLAPVEFDLPLRALFVQLLEAREPGLKIGDKRQHAGIAARGAGRCRSLGPRVVRRAGLLHLCHLDCAEGRSETAVRHAASERACIVGPCAGLHAQAARAAPPSRCAPSNPAQHPRTCADNPRRPENPRAPRRTIDAWRPSCSRPIQASTRSTTCCAARWRDGTASPTLRP